MAYSSVKTLHLLVEDTTVRFADLVPTVMSSDVIAGVLEEGSEDSSGGAASAELEIIGKRFESNRKVMAATIRTRPTAVPFLKGGLVPIE
jgi:hypothetical protein